MSRTTTVLLSFVLIIILVVAWLADARWVVVPVACCAGLLAVLRRDDS
jgi:hypothetical protein